MQLSKTALKVIQFFFVRILKMLLRKTHRKLFTVHLSLKYFVLYFQLQLYILNLTKFN